MKALRFELSWLHAFAAGKSISDGWRSSDEYSWSLANLFLVQVALSLTL